MIFMIARTVNALAKHDQRPQMKKRIGTSADAAQRGTGRIMRVPRSYRRQSGKERGHPLVADKWRQTHNRGSLIDSVDSVPDSSDVRAGHVRGGARLGYKASPIKI